ncbi:MAG: imidazoleglycerol-phosphate dehydratase HisB [Candidatus Diapherotrites archaeon]|nr:imidazoleglycerol-phosphate dehydratase HisB [Candidatus Diapherotrites archaeon]
MNRIGKIERKTNETNISVEINLDGTGKYEINTPIPFFSHMLELLAKTSAMDVSVKVSGDLEHHMIEDTGIALGQTLKQAIGTKEGIQRYGFFLLPMDECLAQCAIDWCNRSTLVFKCKFKYEKVEGMSTDLIEHFFKSLSENASMTINLQLLEGDNEHHKAEALFKAFGKALRMAMQKDPNLKGIPSTKGTI